MYISLPVRSMATNSLVLLHIMCFHLLSISILMCSSRAKFDNYIVHMDLEAMPKAFSNHHNWYKSTLDSISTTSSLDTFTPSSSKLIYTYTHAIQGFSASLTPSELESLKAMPGYLHSTRESLVERDTTHTPQFLGLKPSLGAWPASNYGNDVIIGVIDTGVWPESKSYNDVGFTPIPSKWKGTCESGTQFNSSMCNNKLIGAQYFNKGLLAKHPRIKISMNSARDTEGHGTHTSSTASGSHVDKASYFGYANGTATGMAPHARVAMYKAVWEEGESESDVIAAVDKAISDGVDIISMSLGVSTARRLLDDAIGVATFAAVQKGILVSLSAGNALPFLHNGTPWALTVAAGTVDRTFGGTIRLGNGVRINVESLYIKRTTPKNAPLVLMNECDDVDRLKTLPNDTVVVCLDSDGTAVGEQVYTLNQFNLSGAIFITSYAYTDLSVGTPYPSIVLVWQTGKKVTEYIKMRSVQARVSFKLQETSIGSTVAPKVAFYSARGPSPTCPFVLKPDLMAPGHLILASWPPSGSPVAFAGSSVFYNEFNIIAGTSMACPHASGVAALLKGAHPEWSPAMIRSAMMTTADSLDNTGGQIRDLGMNDTVATALAMGAGHLNPNKALDPGLVYDAEYNNYVDLLCSFNYTKNQMKVFTKSSPYDCSNPSTDLNYPSFIVVRSSKGSGSIEKVFWRTVTNVGEGPATYVVKVTEVDGVKVRVMPEKLVFGDKYEKARFNVTVTVDGKMVGKVVDGSVSWVDTEGKHVVRSPVLVTI